MVVVQNPRFITSDIQVREPHIYLDGIDGENFAPRTDELQIVRTHYLPNCLAGFMGFCFLAGESRRLLNYYSI